MGLWKTIQRWWPFVSNRVSFVVVNGRSVRFLRDALFDEVSLTVYLPSLFAIAGARDPWVRDC